MKTADDYLPQYAEIASAISKMMMDIDMTPNIRFQLAIGLGCTLVALASQHNTDMGLEMLKAVRKGYLDAEQKRNTFCEN